MPVQISKKMLKEISLLLLYTSFLIDTKSEQLDDKEYMRVIQDAQMASVVYLLRLIGENVEDFMDWCDTRFADDRGVQDLINQAFGGKK